MIAIALRTITLQLQLLQLKRHGQFFFLLLTNFFCFFRLLKRQQYCCCFPQGFGWLFLVWSVLELWRRSPLPVVESTSLVKFRNSVTSYYYTKVYQLTLLPNLAQLSLKRYFQQEEEENAVAALEHFEQKTINQILEGNSNNIVAFLTT